MGRKILAVVVAMIVAIGIIMIGQMVMGSMWTPPSPTIREDPAAMRLYIESLPTQAFMVLVGIYAISSFAGGFIVTKMSRRESPGMTLPSIIGVLLLIAGILNFFVFVPFHPLWVTVVCLVSYIPLSLLGHRFAR